MPWRWNPGARINICSVRSAASRRTQTPPARCPFTRISLKSSMRSAYQNPAR
jgi:hypothetical protein